SFYLIIFMICYKDWTCMVFRFVAIHCGTLIIIPVQEPTSIFSCILFIQCKRSIRLICIAFFFCRFNNLSDHFFKMLLVSQAYLDRTVKRIRIILIQDNNPFLTISPPIILIEERQTKYLLHG